jgi:predicted kinase
MSKVILTCGPSGCGKSTWCQKFLAQNPEYIYISSDHMRAIITGDESNQDRNHQVFQTLEHMVSYLMSQRKPLILDATNYSVKNRLIWNRLATAYNYSKKWIVFKTSLEQCLINNEKRERKVPESVIRRQHENLTLPLTENGEIEYVEWVN